MNPGTTNTISLFHPDRAGSAHFQAGRYNDSLLVRRLWMDEAADIFGKKSQAEIETLKMIEVASVRRSIVKLKVDVNP